jgi:guanosine-3',5'-bis(diphosphate) 3'-pyrophosphohydrolase
MRKYTKERYIVHPVRVMEICREYSDDPSVLAAALLHDVIEDTTVSADEIRSFLLTILAPAVVDETVGLVVELTDISTKENHPRLNRGRRKRQEFKRLATASAKAHTIKYADLIDNALDVAKHDPDFARVFLQEATALLAVLTKGDSHLYQLAKVTIASCLDSLIKKPVS